MAKIDVTIKDLFETIFREGREYENKNRGVKRLQIPSYLFKHSFNDGFPAMTNKKLYFSGIRGELQWFLRGQTNISPLIQSKSKIWNDDSYNWYVKNVKGKYDEHSSSLYHIEGDGKYRLFTQEEFINIISNVPENVLRIDFSSNGYTLGDVGKNYGYQWTKWGEKPERNIKLKQPEPILDSKYSPTYLGVACGKNKENNVFGKTWEGMISRCYDKNSISYPLYGGKGVYVCNKWLSFDGFMEDIVNIPNYSEKLKDHRGYVLDKDGLGNGYVYDKDSCQWITNSENNDLMNNKEYVLEKDGIHYSFTNISKFCKEHGASSGNLCKLWTQGAKSSYGFTLVEVKNPNKGLNQLIQLIKDMRSDIMSSRLKVSAWNPSEINETALPPCHSEFQIIGVPLTLDERIYQHDIKAFYEGFGQIYDKELWNENDSLAKGRTVEQYLDDCDYPKFGFELHWNQRSVDTFLGLPFNIASYALLAKVLEAITGFPALGIEGTLKCVHFYDNQYEVAREMMIRDVNAHKNCKLSRFEIEEKDFDKIFDNIDLSGIKLEGYTSDDALVVPMIAPTKL